jgi:MFS family permease
MALNGFSWQLGFIAGPAVGAVILAAEPHALWIVAAAACCLGALAALALERFLPEAVRRTPSAIPPATARLPSRRAVTSSR